jgi:hypothetical protein
MASTSQIESNRRNSQHSTGPRAESGKAKSSKNRVNLGLYTHEDYVKPGEAEIYAEFCQTLYNQLTPANLLEDTFVFEITAASWRLRRCAAAAADLADYREEDPLLDDETDKTRRSTERARAAAMSDAGAPSIADLERMLEEERAQNPENIESQAELASNCSAGDPVAGSSLQIAGSAPCPCRSGEELRRCCGKNAPPMLGKVA